MNLLYICANQMREIIPVDGGSFYQAALAGTLDTDVADMVAQTTAAIQNHGVRLQDLLEITAITYPGALSDPDGGLFESYNHNTITVLGAWRNNATLAVFRIREICMQAYDDFADLTLIEDLIDLAPEQRFSPLVSQFYVQATAAFDSFLAGHVGEGIGRLYELESDVLAEINARTVEVRDGLGLSTEDRHMDLLDVLDANVNLMEALVENLRTMADGLHALM